MKEGSTPYSTQPLLLGLDSLRISVKVITGAERRKASYDGGVLKVWLSSRPVKGKANRELVSFLKFLLGVSKVDIIRGLSSRRKVVDVEPEVVAKEALELLGDSEA